MAVAAACAAIQIHPEWRFQARAILLPAAKIPVALLNFDSAELPAELTPVASRIEQLFRGEMAAGGLFVPHSAAQASGAGRIPKGSIDLLSPPQIAAFRSEGIRTVLTGDFDGSAESPWSPVEIRVRLIDTADGRVEWTGTVQGSTAEIPALVAHLCRAMQESVGGREQTIRRIRQASPEAERLAQSGLEALLRYDLINARNALERAADLNIGSAAIRLRLARAIYDLGHRDLARNEAAAALRLAENPDDRRDAQALEEEFAANWPKAIELRRRGTSNVLERLSLAGDLISNRRFGDADALISRELSLSTSSAGLNRWLLLHARLTRERPGRPNQLAESARTLDIARHSGPPLFLAEALDKSSEAMTFVGNKVESMAAAEESRKIFAGEGHREGVIREMAIMGQRLQIAGSNREAIQLLERAMRAVERAGFDDTEHYVANLLGQAYGRGYDLDLSRRMLTRALALSWKSRNSDQYKLDLSRLGMLYRDLGQLEESRRLLLVAMPTPGERPEPTARNLNALGETELLAGNAQAALDAGSRAHELAAVARAEDVQMDALTVIARALLLRNDPSKIDENFALAADKARKRGMLGTLAFAELQWGEALLIQKRPEAAQVHLRESVRVFGLIDRPAYFAQAHALLAIALARMKDFGGAARELAATEALSKGTTFAYTQVLADYAQACLSAARGQRAEAAKTARLAASEADSFGFLPLAARIRTDVGQPFLAAAAF